MTRETAHSVAPIEWAQTTVGDIYCIVGGGTPPTKVAAYWTGTIPWISSADILANNRVDIRRRITNDAIENCSTHLVPAGSIIVVTRVGLGKVALVETPLCFSQDSQALIGSDSICCAYALRYLSTAVQVFRYWHRGTTIAGVTKQQLRDLPFLLPPLAEQRQIVAKLEELFTRLDAGVEALKKVRSQLKRYRQAVLRDAFTGKLTQEWRERELRKPDSALRREPLDALLPRMSSGKASRKATRLDALSLHQIPSEWIWVQAADIGTVSGGLTKNSKRQELPQKMPYLRVANVYANRLELGDVKSIGVSDKEADRFSLETGDMLVVEGNGSIKQIGRVALWDGSIPGCLHQNHLIKVRFWKKDVGRFAMHWLLSYQGRQHVTRVASSTSGLHTLSVSKVAALPIPLAPEPEQERIVAEIDRHFSIADAIDQTIDQTLKQAERLRQSILKRAFEGKLTARWRQEHPELVTGENSAAKLLERIKAEKAKMDVEQKAERKKKAWKKE